MSPRASRHRPSRPARPVVAASLAAAALLLGACSAVDSERTMMGAGAAVGTITAGPPIGTAIGAIGGSTLHYTIFGERSSTNFNRSCRQLRGCVFSGG